MRNDIVLAKFPYADQSTSKVRPAIVVQCDRLNRMLSQTIVALITHNTKLAEREPTQFLIDPLTPEGKSSGLSFLSAVKCENLGTISSDRIIQTLGHLSDVRRYNELVKGNAIRHIFASDRSDFI